MLRTVSYCLHGLVPASCICADRYDREAVVKALGEEAGLKPSLVLGQLSSTPDELLKLDQVFLFLSNYCFLYLRNILVSQIFVKCNLNFFVCCCVNLNLFTFSVA